MGGQNPPRCKRCFYVLTGLPENRCPECAQEFDPADPKTYTTRPPFVFWTYWVPALCLAVGSGLVLSLGLIPRFGYGVGVSIIIPLMIGCVIGYGVKAGKWVTVALAVLASLAVVLGLMAAGFLGIFCALVLLALGLVPLLFGVIFGVVLRSRMKKSSFPMRSYLPMLAFLLLPLVWCVAEGRHDGLPLVSTRTVMIVDAPPDKTWASIMFYEEVKHEPPWLLKLPLWRPQYTRGSSSNVGDIKVCYYTTGRLTKRVRSVEVGKRLVFDVIEQKGIEDDAVVLAGGSFTLEPMEGGQRTRLTLETTYVPLLTPRVGWRPFEDLAVHTLHGHVMEGMRRMATGLDKPARRRSPAEPGKDK
jgi:hypothetical protein